MINKNKILGYFLMAQFSLQGTVVMAAPVQIDLRYGIMNRELLATKYLSVARRLNNPEDLDALKAWTALVKSQQPNYLQLGYRALESSVKNETVIQFAAQYFYSKNVNSLKLILGLYYTQLIHSIWEISTSPYLSGNDVLKKRAQNIVSQNAGIVSAVETCVERSAVDGTVRGLQVLAQNCLTNKVDVIIDFEKEALNEKGYRFSNQVLSSSGYIPGNKVEVLTQNIYDEEFIRYLAPLTARVQKGVHPKNKMAYSSMSVQDFKSLMTDEKTALNHIFSQAEGFPANDHKVWALTKSNGEKNIYGQMMNAIQQAEKTIFIDMFFIGGSIGLSLAKQLIAKLQSNPQLHVYVINDRKNPLGYNLEMSPVYNYLRAYAEKFPASRLLVMEPRVDLKRTSFPNFMDQLLSDTTLKKIIGTASTEFKSNLSFYPKAKSDHSKVVIIDAKVPGKGTAFVGSKNFTDSSGGVAYDEMIRLEGPVVTDIQDSYYYDVLEAVRDLQGTEYLKSMALKSARIDSADVDLMARTLLKPIDMLDRHNTDYLARIQTSQALKIPAVGTATIMLGENNVYGTIRTALPQDISAIMNAKKQIIISDQFLYDPTVIKALRKRLQDYGSEVKVFVMLGAQDDPASPEKKFVRIPNIVFLQDLVETQKVQIKWKKVPTAMAQALAAVKTSHGITLSPEYHLKGLSVDGVTPDLKNLCSTISNDTRVIENETALNRLKNAMQDRTSVLISGSANKDIMTMMGGFREAQVMIFDQQASIKHDCLFWSRFDHPDHSLSATNAAGNIDYNLMNLPVDLPQKGITPEVFTEILKRIMMGAYNSSVDYF